MNHPLHPRFLRFAESECLGSSDLYYHLSVAIAEDRELLSLAEASRAGQPVPNLFFGAIHYLLDANAEASLVQFYPSLAATTEVKPEQAFPAFRSFALSHREEIKELLATRLVQTNEVRRCAYLFPAMQYAARWFPERPLALMEIGTSAGLNLLWDRYSYDYGAQDDHGDPTSPVSIRSEFRGNMSDALQSPRPQVSHRIGLDLNIVDSTIPEEAAWLRALVWPEHQERRELLTAALQHRSGFDLDLRVGDGFSMVTDLLHEIPEGHVPCIYHTHVANQIRQEARDSFLATVAALGASRDLIHIFNNIRPTLHLTLFHNGEEENIPLAKADGHARWFEWLPT